ncbi:MAG: UDP-N-acetylmuramoyl-L-alanyl-D-glutamate--2,6-diaminopimelate ligase [Phycisphaerae bacterium]|nr:UDP-N-acetylmuramoyl-L-alanyl-D-glutamate--2,6-diaminopimelate ligase [Phycisphaerae bacterium]
MRLSDLIAGEPLRLAAGDGDRVRVCDLTEHSRTVVPGSLFIARPGTKTDGRSFIADAIEAGAVAVLTDAQTSPDVKGVATLVADDVPLASARIAERFFGNPSKRLALIGITGTNGKTTVAHLAHHVLNKIGVRCGLIGTVEIDDGSGIAPAEMTTPPAIELSRSLANMVEAGCDAAVMEVSSHALDQRRAAALAFDVGVITNLSRDHLDYHETMDAYASAKRRLFELVAAREDSPGLAIVNADDPDAVAIAAAAARGRVSPCTASGEAYGGWSVRIGASSHSRTTLKLRGPGIAIDQSVAFLGLHNAMNICQACAASVEVARLCSNSRADTRDDADLAGAVARALSLADPPRGRLEPVHGPGDDIRVYIDFAHTDDALSRTLAAVRSVTDRAAALWVVFGAGGEKDKGKRPRMGRATSIYADRVIVTSDNPRREDPSAIIADVLTGVSATLRTKVAVHADRERAIREAIFAAAPGDVLVIAGKGHETEQVLPASDGTVIRRHFDDREVAQRFLKERHVRRAAPAGTAL